MKPVINTRQMALIGLMTAIICIIAPFSLNIPLSPVPFSFGTLAIYFVVIVLGMKHGTASVIIYLLLGLVGLPIFSNFSGGIGKLLGPTGGYLLGYLFLALISGFFIDRWSGNHMLSLLGLILGTLVCYLFGTAWLAYQSSVTFAQALLSAVIPFLPGDFVKLILAMIIGLQIRKRLAKAYLI